MKKPLVFFVALLSLTVVSPVAARLWLPSIYADNMVLQAEQRLVFQGKADPGAAVRISVLDSKDRALATGETLSFDNVLTGEVCLSLACHLCESRALK